MAKDHKESIVEFCAEISKDPLLVQGAGGNISWKEGDTLWVKASGACLADALIKDIFIPVDFVHMRRSIDQGDFNVTPRLCNSSALKPSIETILHSVLPHTVVLHLHSIDALAYLVRQTSYEMLSKTLQTSLPWEYIPYKKPGGTLGKAVQEAVTNKNNPIVLLLENHGVVIGSNDILEVSVLLNLLNNKLRTEPQPLASTSAPQSTPALPQYLLLEHGAIQSLATDYTLFCRIDTDWALYPDHIVFLGATPVCYNNLDDWRNDQQRENIPELAFVRDVGVFVTPTFSVAKRAQLRCYVDVLRRQTPSTKLRTLNNNQIIDLLNWDAEIYRQNLGKS